MQKKYVVRLTDGEREVWNRLIKKQRASSQKVLRARVLLKADAEGPDWIDLEIAQAFDCRTKTVENIRERFVTEGFEITLDGKPKSRVRGKILDGDQEAKIIALRLGLPPKGYANWTLRLLAEEAVALEIVESVSHETLRGTLNKKGLQQNLWVKNGTERQGSCGPSGVRVPLLCSGDVGLEASRHGFRPTKAGLCPRQARTPMLPEQRRGTRTR